MWNYMKHQGKAKTLLHASGPSQGSEEKTFVLLRTSIRTGLYHGVFFGGDVKATSMLIFLQPSWNAGSAWHWLVVRCGDTIRCISHNHSKVRHKQGKSVSSTKYHSSQSNTMQKALQSCVTWTSLNQSMCAGSSVGHCSTNSIHANALASSHQQDGYLCPLLAPMDHCHPLCKFTLVTVIASIQDGKSVAKDQEKSCSFWLFVCQNPLPKLEDCWFARWKRLVQAIWLVIMMMVLVS